MLSGDPHHLHHGHDGQVMGKGSDAEFVDDAGEKMNTMGGWCYKQPPNESPPATA